MKNFVFTIIRVLILLVILFVGFLGGVFFGNYEEIVTQRFVVPQMEKVIEGDSEQFLRSFVVESEDDFYFESLTDSLQLYYGDLGEIEVDITDSNLITAGPTLCSFIPNGEEDDFDINCVKQEGKRYANYILELEITYDDGGVETTRNEKGLVVFLESDKWYDIFTWKLVRFNRVILEE